MTDYKFNKESTKLNNDLNEVKLQILQLAISAIQDICKKNQWNLKKTWEHLIQYPSFTKEQEKDYDKMYKIIVWAWNHTASLNGVYFEIYNNGNDFRWLKSDGQPIEEIK